MNATDLALICGSRVERYRERMEAAYALGTLDARTVANEFGTGGHSAFGEYPSAWYDGKGLTVGGKPDGYLVTWDEAARRLRALVSNGWDGQPDTIQLGMFTEAEAAS